MRYLIALSLVLVLLFGCTGNQPSAKVYDNNTTQQPTQPLQPTPPVQNTTPPVTNNTQNTSTAPPSNSSQGVMNTSFVPPVLPTFNFTNITDSNGRLIVYFFYSPKCEACVAIRPVITSLEGKYTNVAWQEYDITTWNGTDAYIEFANEHNLSTKQRLVPQVLVDGKIITDRFNINATLENVILNYTTNTPSASRAGAS